MVTGGVNKEHCMRTRDGYSKSSFGWCSNITTDNWILSIDDLTKSYGADYATSYTDLSSRI